MLSNMDLVNLLLGFDAKRLSSKISCLRDNLFETIHCSEAQKSSIVSVLAQLKYQLIVRWKKAQRKGTDCKRAIKSGYKDLQLSLSRKLPHNIVADLKFRLAKAVKDQSAAKQNSIGK